MMPNEYIYGRLAEPFWGPGETHIDFGTVHAVCGRSNSRRRVVRSTYASCHVVRLKAVSSSLIHGELPTSCKTKVANFYVVDAVRAAADEDILRL